MRTPLPSLPARALLAVLLAACAGGRESRSTGGDVGGTVVVASLGEPEHLFPPLVATVIGKQVVDQVFAPLAEVGASMNTLGDADFVPRAAERWTWSTDSAAVDFAMRRGARFHDGRPVTAADVKFSWEVYSDPAVGSPHIGSLPKVDSVVVKDSLTVRVHFGDRSPERFFKFTTNLAVLPRHLLDTASRTDFGASSFAQQPVGSGPFRVVKWERGVSLELAADTANVEGRPALDRLIWRPAADPNAAARSVVAGEADFLELLRPEGIALVTPDGPARTVEFPAPQVGYLLFNTRSPANRSSAHPILGDRALRRSIAQGVDRTALVGNALDSLAVVASGPLPRLSWAADTTLPQLNFNRAAATAALEAAGWKDANGDGIRERSGTPLRLSVMVPSISATRRQMATVLQEQLKALGVDARVEVLEPSVLLPRLVAGKFDAFIHVWQSDASPSTLVQAWGGRDLERSANYGRYTSASVDSALDAAGTAPTLASARHSYRRALEAIVQDAPAVFLWEPRTFALAHKRLQLGRIRGDAWWVGIRQWRIASADRIARDQLPTPQVGS